MSMDTTANKRSTYDTYSLGQMWRDVMRRNVEVFKPGARCLYSCLMRYAVYWPMGVPELSDDAF
jgi:hypothetical protein